MDEQTARANIEFLTRALKEATDVRLKELIARRLLDAKVDLQNILLRK
jgi:hypothetical protein